MYFMVKGKSIAWLAVLLWMALIFYLSHQPAEESSELSSGFMAVFLETIDLTVPFIEVESDGFHTVIRKGAHFFAYFILGLLVSNAVIRTPVKLFLGLGLTIVICVLYAISDEFHQLFIPGRSGEVTDVLIDSTGSAVGIGLWMIVRSLWNRKR